MPLWSSRAAAIQISALQIKSPQTKSLRIKNVRMPALQKMTALQKRET